MQEDEEEDVPQEADIPADSKAAAQQALGSRTHTTSSGSSLQLPESEQQPRKRSFSKLAKSAIFREVSHSECSSVKQTNLWQVVLAKVREMKAEEEKQRTINESTGKASSK